MSREQLAELLIAHAPQLRQMAAYYYKVRLLSHRAAAAWDADDLYQEVQLRALRRAEAYEDGNFLGWMHLLTRNLATNIINKERKKPIDTGIYQEYEGRISNAYRDTEPLPDEQLQNKFRAVALHKAIGELSDNHQLATLYTLEERHSSNTELAQELGIPEMSLRQFSHQARKHLRKNKNLNLYNPKQS